MKRILVINGHPDKLSLCNELAHSYKKGADAAGADCMLVNLSDLKFNTNLSTGYRERAALEPDLIEVQQEILDAEHIVFVYPNWWGTYPALMKGFFDRILLPGYAFSYRKNSLMVNKLLKGKSARLMVTMDTPKWYYSIFRHSPGHHSMKSGILGFCGIKPVKITSFGPVISSNEGERMEWILKAEKMGKMLK
jgi:NAD(P)H dehydrogenase (quinone)